MRRMCDGAGPLARTVDHHSFVHRNHRVHHQLVGRPDAFCADQLPRDQSARPQTALPVPSPARPGDPRDHERRPIRLARDRPFAGGEDGVDRPAGGRRRARDQHADRLRAIKPGHAGHLPRTPGRGLAGLCRAGREAGAGGGERTRRRASPPRSGRSGSWRAPAGRPACGW